ncbi:MAG: uroporphyrinogen-III C-methyltransferase [Pirellulaceae bacterium]
MNAAKPPVGRVCLVGAGPGDPGLITVRGLDRLSQADVVLYDYLTNPQLLRFVKPGAQAICLGRHGGTRIWTQQEINARLIELARGGKLVVRLKNGDPAIFARGAEEAQAMSEAAIPFEMVPGITAALAAGSYAGIPVTHRNLASAVALVTGQQTHDESGDSLDYQALARFPGTLVFYMGVTTAADWTTALITAGKPIGTPAAIVRRCSLPDQVVIRCTLGDVASRLAPENKIRPPVVVIVGEVANLAGSLDWFDRRPLFGRRVLITRPEAQANRLASLLEDQGAHVVRQPAIRIGPPADWGPVDAALANLAALDWLVFSSSNGVQYLLDRLLANGGDLRALASIRLAAIGPGTSEALRRYYLRADRLPDTYRAESLAAALARDAPGKRFLLARASRGREVLAKQLIAAGGLVEQVVVYQSEDCPTPNGNVTELLASGQINYTTVTSSAIAKSLANMFGDKLRKSRLVSISPITSSALRQIGLEPAIEASDYTMQGVVDAILRDVGK